MKLDWRSLKFYVWINWTCLYWKVRNFWYFKILGNYEYKPLPRKDESLINMVRIQYMLMLLGKK